MNINEIKLIVNAPMSDELKRKYILTVIADDKDAIPSILEILNAERSLKDELILDSNVELSRALIILRDKNLTYNKDIICDPKWASDEIIKHYDKWSEHIQCNFKIK